MKKIILLIVTIVSINYNVKAQISLTGNITTAGVAVYPTHIDSLGKGGLMTLPDLTTRNAIPVKRRKQGMLVYIQANDSLYKLTTADVSLNTGWVAMGLLTQQKLSDSLNARLKATDTLSLSARIDLKANAGTISDVTTLLADKLKITDTSFLLQKADTASLSNRINLKANTDVLTALTTTVGTKFKTTDTSYLLQKADTISLSNRINLKLDANKTGVANGVASLNALGKIPSDQIPAISFSSVRIISSEAEMLGLTSAVVGSVAVRTDVNKSYILSVGDPTVLANWVMLLTPAPPVQSVNTYSGNVNLTKTDVGLGNVDDYSAENLPLSLASRNALALKFKTTDTAYLLQKADTISLSNRIISSVASITAETTRATAAETTLTNKITSNTSSITTILNSITTLNTNVSANTSSITSLTTKINSNTASITANTSDILLRATILSPSFTGTPTATTAPALTNTTQLATTAFVRTAVTNLTGLTNSNLSGSAGITDANLANITTAGKVSNSATSATASNTSYTIVARDAVGDFSANNITASLNGTALTATNIEGGAAGSIPYQSANNTTALLAKGTNGQFLQLTSGIPSWQTISTTVSASNITGTVALSNGGTGQTDVAEDRLARHDLRIFYAGDGLADDLEGLRILQLDGGEIRDRLLRRLRRQGAIGHGAPALAVMHHARIGFAVFGGHVPALRGRSHQHLASRSAHAPQGIVIRGRRIAAARMLAPKDRLVEGRLLDPDVLPGHVQLLGDDHREHGSDALSDLRVFRQDRDDAIGGDAHIGGDARSVPGSRAGAAGQGGLQRKAAADGEAGAQEGAAGQVHAKAGVINGRGHHDYFASATCLMPARMRV